MDHILSKNSIYYADSLSLLERIPSETITLAFVDPPFIAKLYRNNQKIENNVSWLRKVIRQIKRVLTKDGNLFFYSEPISDGIVRPLLDEILGKEYFQNSYNLPRRILSSNFQRNRISSDTLFHYSKSHHPIFNPIKITKSEHKLMTGKGIKGQIDENGREYITQTLFTSNRRPNLMFEWNGIIPPSGQSWMYSKTQLEIFAAESRIVKSKSGSNVRLKRYLDEMYEDITYDWSEVSGVYSSHKENLHYGGQKSLQLMDKIINIGSNEGDVVLDVFCGTGTTFISAHNKNRRWIGCDLSLTAYGISLKRLRDLQSQIEHIDFIYRTQFSLENSFELVQGSSSSIFISYSRRDHDEYVVPFCKSLEALGLDFWLDQRSIEIGSQWEEEIQKGLEKCDVMVLFLSPSATQSEYVRYEYEKFLDMKKTIFPLMCIDTELPEKLKSIEYKQYAQHNELLEKLRKECL